MPSERTLQRRIEHIKFKPGILFEIFEILNEKVKSFAECEKDCFLYIDEMSIDTAKKNMF